MAEVAAARAWRLVLFGASGAIGTAVGAAAEAAGWDVLRVSRTVREGDGWIAYDPLADPVDTAMAGQAPFDAVVFAQGANGNDSVATVDLDAHRAMYAANCLSPMAALSMLVLRRLLSPDGARIVIVSSIWQERARAGKLSYAMTKAAIGGLVRSASVDLGADGHLVNGVLPGVLDTPMTRANLSAAQIAAVAERSPLARLADPATVASTICYLCSAQNHGITGQSITVDLGMSHAVLL